jgi:hypothetical protein
LPLSERVRIEVYLPDLPRPAYQDLLISLEQEFTHTFGGCTTVRGVDGNFLSELGVWMRDRISVIYTDTFFVFDKDYARLTRYVDALHVATQAALDEEAVLIAAYPVHHAVNSRRHET